MLATRWFYQGPAILTKYKELLDIKVSFTDETKEYDGCARWKKVTHSMINALEKSGWPSQKRVERYLQHLSLKEKIQVLNHLINRQTLLFEGEFEGEKNKICLFPCGSSSIKFKFHHQVIFEVIIPLVENVVIIDILDERTAALALKA